MRTSLSAALALAACFVLAGCTPSEQPSALPPAPGTPPPPTGVRHAPRPAIFRGHVYVVRLPDTNVERPYLAVSDRDYGNPERGSTFVGAPLSVAGEPGPIVVPLSDPHLRAAGFVHCGELESLPVDEIMRDLGEVGPADLQRVDAGVSAAMGLGPPPTT